MTSVIKADSGAISGITGLTSTADNSGTLELQATSGLVTAQNVTGGFIPPSGTTAQRPSSPVAGTTRFNTTLNAYEVYNGGWITLASQVYSATYLLVAGGGGGGGSYNSGGGGGAGGLLTGTASLSLGTTYSVIVGGGGAPSSTYQVPGTSGSNSTGLSLTAIGGGAGGSGYGSTAGNPLSGGSGGGGWCFDSGGSNSPAVGAAGTSGQGHAGGDGFVSAHG